MKRLRAMLLFSACASAVNSVSAQVLPAPTDIDPIKVELKDVQIIIQKIRFATGPSVLSADSVKDAMDSPQVWLQVSHNAAGKWNWATLGIKTEVHCGSAIRKGYGEITISLETNDRRDKWIRLPEELRGCQNPAFDVSVVEAAGQEYRLERTGNFIDLEKEAARESAIAAAALARANKAKAAERERTRAICASLYSATANKKLSDLTVKEDQQVRACQFLGLYPPR